MIKVEGLTKRYASYTAVNQISFEVQKGQIVGFLGPNGAGKTTTMRVLTCFLPPSEGSAEVAGFNVTEQPMEVKRRIGYLPETPPVYPDMEVEEYLKFVGRLKGLGSAELAKRVPEVAERCAVADVKHKLIGKLSKGYRQRVGLAQAILHNPDVLILDEPTAGLDPRQIIETRDLIKSLAGDHTIILSTHILPEVEQTCEQVIIIAKGRLVAQGPVGTVGSRRGTEVLAVEVDAKGSAADSGAVRQKLEQVAGVSKVVFQHTRNDRHLFEVEPLSGKNVRADLARAIVEAGWNLNELKSVTMSLEQVFLQVTSGDAELNAAAATPAGGAE